MKNTFLSMLVFVTGSTLLAQPVFEYKYDESVNICYLESVGEAYYSMDVINKQCHIYRMDHSLYKSIPIPTPEGYYLSDVQFVTEKLFNDDPLVELVYSYTKYVPTTTSYYYTYETKLVNEIGNVTGTWPGAGYTNVIETPGHGKKFLVYEYNYSVIPYRTYTHVYSLPEAGVNAIQEVAPTRTPTLPYPNPADQLIHIPIEFPAGDSEGTLQLFDLNGNLVLTYPVTNSDTQLVLPTHQLTTGTYLYYIQTSNSRTEPGKIIVPH
jgi:hypothetical protein